MTKLLATWMATPAPLLVFGVFVAGGVGAVLRYGLALGIDVLAASRLPQAGVLACNLLGCFAIALVAALFADGWWRVVLMTGLLGGFTTYSAFALYSAELLQAARYGTFVVHLASQVLGGVVAVAAGLLLARQLGGR